MKYRKFTIEKGIWKRLAVLAIAILTCIILHTVSQVERHPLLENEGREFVTARVTQVLVDNQESGGVYIGDQTVQLELLSGAHKGTSVEAESSSAYLYGVHCTQGMKVVAIISESGGELVGSVYGFYREPVLLAMIALFLLTIVLIGGRRGLYSVIGLVFTFVCIFWFFLPMVYRGYSPVVAAIIVVIATTLVTMYLVGGFTVKATAAVIGTVMGVLVAGVFAYIFGKLAHVTGYNVSDIESLIYIQEQLDIQVGQLLFAGILIAALGAVMDVSMSIASTLQELHDKNPQLNARQLFHSGMTVGHDMMGTMSNTLILAFTGGSINTLVLFYAYAYSRLQVVNMFDIAIEIIQGVSASMGVVLTVPFVSLIGAWMIVHQANEAK
ncbi:MAG: YibE/F family protein [Eubacteriales bacterium]|nr:YibE/F family protein [Eubacteriales bacterium]